MKTLLTILLIALIACNNAQTQKAKESISFGIAPHPVWIPRGAVVTSIDSFRVTYRLADSLYVASMYTDDVRAYKMINDTLYYNTSWNKLMEYIDGKWQSAQWWPFAVPYPAVVSGMTWAEAATLDTIKPAYDAVKLWKASDFGAVDHGEPAFDFNKTTAWTIDASAIVANDTTPSSPFTAATYNSLTISSGLTTLASIVATEDQFIRVDTIPGKVEYLTDASVNWDDAVRFDSVFTSTEQYSCYDSKSGSACAVAHYRSVEDAKTFAIIASGGKIIDLSKNYRFIPRSQLQAEDAPLGMLKYLEISNEPREPEYFDLDIKGSRKKKKYK